jgi:cysteine desulfurase
MTANNEIGTVEPIGGIGEIARDFGIVFHTDAVQAAGAVPLDVNLLKVDLLSLSAHKFCGPKGTGALYIRRGTRIDPLIHGGEQERLLRAGTENTAGIVGMGKAIEEAVTHLEDRARRMEALRDRLINRISSEIPDCRLNGSVKNRLPNNCNICFEGIDGEALLLRLDLAGIAASSGSACTAGTQETSHVLTAIGLSEQLAKGSLRLTTGYDNTEDEINQAVCALKEIVADLRSMFHGA